jgi:hypothetical protein
LVRRKLQVRTVWQSRCEFMPGATCAEPPVAVNKPITANAAVAKFCKARIRMHLP